ncbi:DUF3152 domain-containing protein [Nocardioides solisilvae]|uniref:DUF3152 domain-containing protein n=1 Tax=Nocardioides solisilvae TaxID=1542435 RepID=UPI000D74A9C5|nr:DUF3152 domain-containing protein [Nocardioides solisilvae]
MSTRPWLLPVLAPVLLLAGLAAGPAGAVPLPDPRPTPAPAPAPRAVPSDGPSIAPTLEPTPTPTLEPTPTATPAAPVATRLPRIRGEARWTRTLRADPGRWTPRRETTRYRWLRDGEPVPGARGRTYRIRPDDVGSRLRVEVRVRVSGLPVGVAVSRPTPRVRHRVPARRVVTYHVETRGDVSGVPRFARLAQQTFDDPRGWRDAGVELRRVRAGGQFSLVLAEASWLPRFSSVCSSTWSCRVGRYVVINQTRWNHASPAWNAAGRSLRDYRHMVVNHETGHWLGRGHRTCPGRDRPAPVMMQQSKGTGGCRFNPWPLPSER